MLILLPPSEGKTAPTEGPVLDLRSLSFPELLATRKQVLDALTGLCRSRPNEARKALALGPTQGDEIRRNASLKRAPAGAAIDVYTGVLFDALDAASLNAAQRRRLQAGTAIASALFGLLRPDDLIPAYRLSADTSLPPLGALAPLWRDRVSAEIERSTGPILDLRSQAYVNLGPLPASVHDRALVARVLLERNGRRSVVSHHNKATKGRLVRGLVSAGALPRTVDRLLDSITALGYRVELHESRKGAPVLDVIVRET